MAYVLVYQPKSFRIKGAHTRDIMKKIRPGDVLMRGYVNYLDGYFIPKGKSKCSHSGLYIGDGKVVHAIAEGLLIHDIIDFCRTDRIVVLRPEDGQEWAIEHAIKCEDADIEYDFNFTPDEGKYYCHEFTASCFPNFEIEMLSQKILGLIPAKAVYLSDSFYLNEHFKEIYSK